MPIRQPEYQLKLGLDLPEEAPASQVLSAEDVRIRAEAARAQLEGGNLWPKDAQGKSQTPAWYEQYLKLVYGGWPWRVAVLIAWMAMDKPRRWPATQDELAIKILGLNSDRQFSVWMAKNPAIAAQVHDVRFALVWDNLSDVLAAGMAVAMEKDYKGRGDREMIYKMAGILSDKVQAEIYDKSAIADLSKLSFGEKLRLAGLDSAGALAALKEKLIQDQENDDEPDESSDAG